MDTRTIWALAIILVLGTGAVATAADTPDELLALVHVDSGEKSNTELRRLQDRLANGADANTTGKGGRSLLMEAAAWTENERFVQVLLDAGAEVNAVDDEGSTALLHNAASGSADNPAVTRVLVEAGALLETRDQNGRTALMYAVGNPQKSRITRALIGLGADVTVTQPEADIGLLDLVAAGGEIEPEIITALVKAGMDPNRRGAFGIPPLGLMVQNQASAAMVEALLAAGAEVDATFPAIEPALGDGWTALLLAAMYSRDVALVQTLIDSGADVNRVLELGGNRLTPLILATNEKTSVPSIMIALINAGADVTVTIQDQTLAEIVQGNKKLRGSAELVRRVGGPMEPGQESK